MPLQAQRLLCRLLGRALGSILSTTKMLDIFRIIEPNESSVMIYSKRWQITVHLSL
jgi:hypothetical protein